MQTVNAAGEPLSQAFIDEMTSPLRSPRFRVYVNWLNAADWAPVPGGTSANVGPNDDISKYLTSVHVERSMSNDDVPPGARILTGLTVSSAEVMVTGDPDSGTPGYTLWSPYATSEESPFAETSSSGVRVGVRRAGAQCRIFAGSETLDEWVCVFTGYVRGIDMDYGASQATIEAYDPSERLRAKPIIPSFVADQNIAGNGDGFSWLVPSYWGADGHYLIDAILRSNGIYQSSPMHPNAVLSVPGHGSLYPETDPNFLGATTSGQTPFARCIGGRFGPGSLEVKPNVPEVHMGPHGEYLAPPAPVNGITQGITFAYDLTVQGKDITANDNSPSWNYSSPFPGMQFEAKVFYDNDPFADFSPAGGFPAYWALGYAPNQAIGTLFPAFYVTLMPDATIEARAIYGDGLAVSVNTEAAVPSDGNPYYIGVHFLWVDASTVDVTFNVGGVIETGTLSMTTAKPSSISRLTSLQGQSCIPWYDLQVIRTSSPDWSHATVVKTAELDQSLNPIQYVPYNANPDDSITTAAAVAAAEMGSVGFDESGVFRFYNRRHFLVSRDADLTIDYEDDLDALRTSEAVDAVVNDVTIPVSPYAMQPVSWVWATEHIRYLHAGQTAEIIVHLDDPCYMPTNAGQYLDYGGITLSDGGGNNPAQLYFRACSNQRGTGGDVWDKVSSTAIMANPQLLIITLTNNSSRPVFFVSPKFVKDSVSNKKQVPDSSVGKPMIQAGAWKIAPYMQGNVVTSDGSGNETITRSQGSTLTEVYSTDEDSADRYGWQSWTAKTSVYRQHAGAMQQVSDDTVSLLSTPAPQLGDVTIGADPRIQIGDLANITAQLSGLNVYGYLRKYVLDFNKSDGFVMTLSTQGTIPSFGWVLGDKTNSVLGNTTILGGLI